MLDFILTLIIVLLAAGFIAYRTTTCLLKAITGSGCGGNCNCPKPRVVKTN